MPKRKSNKTAANDPATLFQPIGEHEADPVPTVDDRIAQLQKTIEGLQETVKAGSAREDRLQGMFMQLAASGGRQQDNQQVAPQNVSGIDFSKLPDPEKDPTAYRNALQEQINGAIQTQVSATVQPVIAAQDRANKIKSLWDKFEEKYEDLAGFKDIAEVVAGRVLRDAGVKSPDEADRAMFADQDGFLDKVAKNMRDRIAQIKGTEEDEDEGEGSPEPERTIGIQGAGGPSGGRGAGADKPSTMLDELKGMQKGIYY